MSTIVALVILLTGLSAQRRESDAIPATDGNITVTPIMHATLQITYGHHVVMVDPTTHGRFDGPYPSGGPPRIDYEGLPPPTLILVTDIHGDHFDPKAIDALRSRDTAVIVPFVPGWRWPIAGASVMANGERHVVNDVAIEAVPMYNVHGSGQPFHPKGRGNGYVVTLGGKRIYVAGDTGCTSEMKALRSIDVAFVPMNLPYTMTPLEAAECVKAFAPRIVYPYHYRGQDVRTFERALDGGSTELRLRDWYPGG